MAPRKKPIKKPGTRAKRSPGVRKFQTGGLGSNIDTGYGNQPLPNETNGGGIGGFNDSSWGAYEYGSYGTMIGLNTAEGEDMLSDTQKITAGYFTGGSGQLAAASVHTTSLADSNEAYYFNIAQTHPLSASAATQFSIAYGHAGGSGSDTDNGDIQGPTKAIYGQWSSRLLSEAEVSGGFRISVNEGDNPTNKALSDGTRDEDIFILVGKRERFKDRINKKNWTIALSGSNYEMSGTQILHLTDDSANVPATSTVAGDRYNIVSGANGAVSGTGKSDRVYGWFYPEQGAMVFSRAELSHSIGGHTDGASLTASFDAKGTDVSFSSSMGFGVNTNSNGNSRNALRFVNCLRPPGAKLQFRSEEDQVSVSYFCRVRAKDLNFSNNPTFVSGSANEMANTDMWGNPQVYITGIGLYGAGNQLVAVGKLSTPLKKNFSSEATIKVKLTY